MDTVNEVIKAISTVGFPIVVCVICMWYVKYQGDKNAAEIARLNEEHTKEVKEMTSAINNNTLALQKLCERMDKDGG